jgi:hypothetical protein
MSIMSASSGSCPEWGTMQHEGPNHELVGTTHSKRIHRPTVLTFPPPSQRPPHRSAKDRRDRRLPQPPALGASGFRQATRHPPARHRFSPSRRRDPSQHGQSGPATTHHNAHHSGASRPSRPLNCKTQSSNPPKIHPAFLTFDPQRSYCCRKSEKNEDR